MSHRGARGAPAREALGPVTPRKRARVSSDFIACGVASCILALVALSLIRRVYFSDEHVVHPVVAAAADEGSHTDAAGDGMLAAAARWWASAMDSSAVSSATAAADYDVVVVKRTTRRRSEGSTGAATAAEQPAAGSADAGASAEQTVPRVVEGPVAQPPFVAVPVAPAAPPAAATLPAARIVQPASPPSQAAAEPGSGDGQGAAALPTVLELLPKFDPLWPYASQRKQWKIALATPWFQSDHPYFTGILACPASGCVVHMTNRQGMAEADVVLYHARDTERPDNAAPPAFPSQGIGLMLGETFEVCNRERWPAEFFEVFNMELSYRARSFVRDTYATWFIGESEKQGLGPQPALRTDARVWQDIWRAPVPYAQRRRDVLASWGSHYCRGARSNREQLVRELMEHIPVAVFGDPASNCMVNVKEPLRSAERREQFGEMSKMLFHFSFENARSEGYVTEKFYWALLRGQVPVVFGAPDIDRFAPGPGSYIDASKFPSAKALADFLAELAADEDKYAALHAWRTQRSFADYGDVLRQELLELIWIGNHTMHNVAWFNCMVCHAMERDAAKREAELGSLGAPRPLGIPPIDCIKPWGE